MRPFFITLLLSFTIALAILFGLVRQKHPTDSPQAAKHRREWWVRPPYSEELGTPIRLNASQTQFEEAFPGYTLPKGSFWSRYFSYPFDADIRLDSQRASEDALIPTPWLACADFYREQHADILFLGTSELYRTYYPPAYRAQFANAKLLNCGRSALLPPYATQMLRILKSYDKPKVKALVIGYTLSWAYPDEKDKDWFHDSMKSEMNSFSAFPRQGLSWLWNLDGEQLFGRPSWDTFTPSRRAIEKRNASIKEVPPLAPGQFYQRDRSPNIFLRREDLVLVGTPQMKPLPYYRFFDTGKPPVCTALDVAEKEFKELMTVASELAEHIYLYIPPITPMGEENFSPCFREFAEKTLLSYASPRVHVRTDKWESYGMDWSDFIYPTANPEIIQTDLNHSNYQGSRKVSKVLAQWLARDWSEGRLAE